MATAVVFQDNPANLKLADLLLRMSGHLMLCAADAEAGVALARADCPDPVLLDVAAL